MTDSMKTDKCEICDDKFNKTTRRPVPCEHCTTIGCLSCFSSWMGAQNTMPTCMGCSREYDLGFLRDYVGPTCMKKVRQHVASIDLEKEKNLLPTYMPYVEAEREAEKIKAEQDNILLLIRQLQRKHTDLDLKRLRLLNGDIEKKERREFIRPCTQSGCKGFLSTAYKCGLCEVKVCKDCMSPDSEDHECNPEDVASVEEIKKSTKPCPTCGTSIFKPGGCDHMFCTKPGCHTSFSWKTLKVIPHNRNTNPHYLEWARENNTLTRAAGDLGMPGIYYINQHTADLPRKDRRFVSALYGTVHHYAISDQGLQKYEVNPFLVNRDIGMSYIKGEIDEKKWERTLKTRRKRSEFNSSVYDILNDFVNEMRELISGLTNSRDKAASVQHMRNRLQDHENRLSHFKSDFGSKSSLSIKEECSRRM